MTDQLTFEVTDVKQWTYCPRIVFYRFCWPDVRPVTDLMRAGIRSHVDESEREARRSLRTYGLTSGERHFDLPLSSPTLGLRGRIDLAIAVPNRTAAGAEGVVVEYKDSERADQPQFKRQLATYALLLEEAWSIPVRKGFLYSIPQRLATAVAFTATMRQRVRDTLVAMHTTVRREQMPDPPVSRAPCSGCEFRRFCNDVV